MKNLLATLVILEYIRKKPSSNVIDWLDEQEESYLFIGCLTIAELKKDYYKLVSADPRHGSKERAQKIGAWIQKLEQRFDKRVLPADESLFDRWASLCGRAEAEGRKLPVFDSLLAATAQKYNLPVVAHNIADFKNCLSSIKLYDPY